jgi:Fe-Mn family superoxide dismutase
MKEKENMITTTAEDLEFKDFFLEETGGSLEFRDLPEEEYVLPKLLYSYKALEPHIPQETMFLHHKVHHASYVDNLNRYLSEHKTLKDKSLNELLRLFWKMDEIRHFGGGHYNHTLLWNMLTPDAKIVEDIFLDYTTLEDFKKRILQEARSHFGCGWVWYAVNRKGIPQIYSMDKQDNPLMRGDFPVWGLDLWEHAYYKKYGPNKEAYIRSVFEVTNWLEISKRLERGLLGQIDG